MEVDQLRVYYAVMVINRAPGWPGVYCLPDAEGGHKRGGMVLLCPI